MVNHRGEIATVVRLGAAIAVESGRSSAEQSIVIFVQNKSASTKGEMVGLMVDQIGEIIEIDAEGAGTETVPESIHPQLRGVLQFACRRREKLLLALDLEQVFRLPGLNPVTPGHFSLKEHLL